MIRLQVHGPPGWALAFVLSLVGGLLCGYRTSRAAHASFRQSGDLADEHASLGPRHRAPVDAADEEPRGSLLAGLVLRAAPRDRHAVAGARPETTRALPRPGGGTVRVSEDAAENGSYRAFAPAPRPQPHGAAAATAFGWSGGAVTLNAGPESLEHPGQDGVTFDGTRWVGVTAEDGP